MKAKQFSSSLVFGREVIVQSHERDRHGRTVGDVVLADGSSLNRELLKAGLAWWYRKYSTDPTLEALEHEARAAKRGLWSDSNPTPPWEFRHPPKKEDESTVIDSPENDGKMAGRIIGNEQSRVYHRPDCPSYTATKPKNRRMFGSVLEAEAAGYRLAGPLVRAPVGSVRSWR